MLLKKRIAILLAVAMTVGSCVTVFAGPTSGSTTGTGDSYDHVDTEIIEAELPTIDESNNPFDFVVDPERLVNRAKTLGTGKGVSANDDGVYFYHQTADELIGASSNKLVVSTNSSVSIDVIASVTLDDKATSDIKLVKDETELAAETDPALLLKIAVSENETWVSYNGTARVSDEVEGVSENFIFEADPTADPTRIGQFVFRVKDGTSEGEELKPWNSTYIQLKGKVNEAQVPEGHQALTVPQIKVTWTFKKVGDPDPVLDVAPSAAATQAVLEAGKTADIIVDLGKGSKAATGVASVVNVGLGNDWLSPSVGAASYADGKITLTKTTDVDYLLGAGSANTTFRITFNDTANTTVDVTVTPKS